MKREIISKNNRICNNEEIDLIIRHEINNMKLDDIKLAKTGYVNIANNDEEIDVYLDFKNNLLYAFRSDLNFNTNETKTFFTVMYLHRDISETDCYETHEDLENDVNSFIDKRGNYDKIFYVYEYINGLLEDITDCELLFTCKPMDR